MITVTITKPMIFHLSIKPPEIGLSDLVPIMSPTDVAPISFLKLNHILKAVVEKPFHIVICFIYSI